jgi:hypothetical protein
MCSRKFLTTFLLVDFEVLMQNFENALEYCREVGLTMVFRDLTHGWVYDQVNHVSEHA